MTTAGLLFVVAWGNERPLWQRTVLALAALLVGIGSKETAVVFPALALAVGSRRRGYRTGKGSRSRSSPGAPPASTPCGASPAPVSYKATPNLSRVG